MPDPTRTYRLSDELYAAAQERAWQRRDKGGVAGVAQLAVRAYAVDPDALEAACAAILEGGKR